MKTSISNFFLNVDILHLLIAISIITVMDIWVYPFTNISDYITNITSGLTGGIVGVYAYRRIRPKKLK